MGQGGHGPTKEGFGRVGDTVAEGSECLAAAGTYVSLVIDEQRGAVFLGELEHVDTAYLETTGAPHDGGIGEEVALERLTRIGSLLVPVFRTANDHVGHDTVNSSAPVAQRIEHRPPEPGAQVRVLPGALSRPTAYTLGLVRRTLSGEVHLVTEDSVEIKEDVVFGTGGHRDLRCDVYSPTGGGRRKPAVLLVHGGGWRRGDKTQLRGYGILLGRAGFVCVASEYRLVGESPWPAQIHDVKAALRWTRANADELGIDPDRIALEGNSAGAHLVLFAAGTVNDAAFDGLGGNPGVDTSMGAVIAVYPPTRFDYHSRRHGGVPIEALSDTPSAALADEASPLNLAGPRFPPTMLIHGGADEVVPVASSFLMYERLIGHNVATELHVFAEQRHGFDADPRFGYRTADLMVLFLRRYLSLPEAEVPRSMDQRSL